MRALKSAAVSSPPFRETAYDNWLEKMRCKLREKILNVRLPWGTSCTLLCDQTSGNLVSPPSQRVDAGPPYPMDVASLPFLFLFLPVLMLAHLATIWRVRLPLAFVPKNPVHLHSLAYHTDRMPMRVGNTDREHAPNYLSHSK